MRKIFFIISIAFIFSCAAPISQTSLTYSGTDAIDKMITALVDTKWDITHTEKSTGLIVANKITSIKQFVADAVGTQAKSHVATIKIDGDVVNVSVKYPEGDPAGAGKDECNRLKEEIINRFNELIKK